MSMTMERAATGGETAAELAEQFARDGFVVARGLFAPREVAEIRETFMTEASSGPVEGLSDGHYRGLPETDPLAFYPRMMHPHSHPELSVGPLSTRYMLDARIGEVLTALMADEPLAVQSMFYFKPAGARGQDLHQDNFYLRVRPDTCYAAWVAVDDADEGNGGMMVVPGSQNMEIACPQKSDAKISFTDAHVPVPDGLEAVTVPLKAGDVLFFNGSVIHGSYPNTSENRFRRALIFHYVPEGSTELSQGYRNPMRFDGTPRNIPAATGGGPCGTPHEAAGPH